MGATDFSFSRSARSLFVLLVAGGGLLLAQTPTRIIYVNGIMNSKQDVLDRINRMNVILSASINHTASKRLFSYPNIKNDTSLNELLYNPIGYDGSNQTDNWLSFQGFVGNCVTELQDSHEIFVLKSDEENYALAMSQMLGTSSITSSGTPPATSIPIDKVAAVNVAQYATAANMVGLVTLSPMCSDPQSDNLGITVDRMLGTANVVTNLVNEIKLNGPAIVVAHSQGNLLANLAYATLAADPSIDDVRKHMVIVNVANTSRFSTDGLDLTHPLDSVLYPNVGTIGTSLQNLPVNFGWMRTTAEQAWVSAPFIIHPVMFQMPYPGFWPCAGPCSHGILETYLADDRYVDPIDGQFPNGTFTFSTTPVPGDSPDLPGHSFRSRFEDLIYAAVKRLDLARYGTQLPVISALNSYSASAASPFLMECSAADPDGTVVSATIQDDAKVIFPTPMPCVFTPAQTVAITPLITIPANMKGQTLSFTISATDNSGATVSKKTDVVVAPNVAPQFGFIPHYSITSGQPLSISIPVSDSDGKVVSASIAPNATDFYPLASSWSVSDVNGISQLSASLNTVSLIAGRTYSFNVTIIDDNGAPATQTVYFDVTAPNAKPVASIERQLNSPDGTVTLLGLATDPDGISEKGRWVCTDAAFPFDSGPLSLTTSGGGSFTAAPFQIQLPTVTSDTTLRFTYTVTDESGLASDPAMVDVLVKATPLPGTFFDDFDVPSLNLDNWTADTDGSGSALNISGGVASLHRSTWGYVSYWQIRSKNEFGPGTRVELRGRLADYFVLTPYSGSAPFGCGFRGVGLNLYAYGSCYEGGGPWYDGVSVFDQYFPVGGSQAYNQYHDMVVDYRKDGVVELKLDGVLLFQTPTAGMTQLLHIEINASKPGDAPTLLDNCRVTVY